VTRWRTETIGDATLICGDCREVLPTLGPVDAVVTDPPYPNGEGHFVEAIAAARDVLGGLPAPELLVFWSELEFPQAIPPLVATHIWHRTNVNGKLYEPIYHFAADGRKRRSEVFAQAAVFDGVGPGCAEYAGHPTQKPLGVMRRLLALTPSKSILDPFMGSGSTGVAALQLGRQFTGVESNERYFEIALRRVEETWRQPRLFAEPKPKQEELAL
jgi:site-specific DNA-methyltransferase (adenine-specific)